MRVLGVDPGLATTGYAVLEARGDRIRVLEAGVIRTSPEDPLPERLRTIYEDARRLIRDHRPDVLAVEEVFFNQNVTTAMSVSQARGVVLLAGALSGLPCAPYTPLEVKRQITGYGRARKPQMQAMVQRLLRLNDRPKPDDAADALAVALCHLLRERSGLRAYAMRK